VRQIDEQLLDNTFQALERAEKVRVKLEAVAEAVRLKLEATNKIIMDNQDKLKEEVAEVAKEQIKAVAKDILDKETYRKDIVELNAKLDKLLEKRK
jgi:predicted exporter